MSSARVLEPEVPRHRSAKQVRKLVDLAEILSDDVNIVVYRGRVAHAALAEADELASQPGFGFRTIVDADADIPLVLAERLDGAHALARSIATWIAVVRDLTEPDAVGVRLQRVVERSCPRFHVDAVALRLLVTYAGAGTEYADNLHVDRRLLGSAGADIADVDARIVANPKMVCRAHRGDAVLLKGSAWPNNSDRGAVHRSPVASSETPRLVLTLDPIFR